MIRILLLENKNKIDVKGVSEMVSGKIQEIRIKEEGNFKQTT
jgi:hypothetical protein